MQPSPNPHFESVSPIIRASEIGQYVFCQRAWWLGTIQGYRSVNEAMLEAGTQAHLQHGRGVALLQRWQRLGYALMILGGALLIIVVLWALLGGGW